MAPQHSRPLCLDGENLPPLDLSGARFQERFANVLNFARPHARESWWYGLWTEVLHYLCLATSVGITGSGIPRKDKKRGATFFLYPQNEVICFVLRPLSQGMFCPATTESGLVRLTLVSLPLHQQHTELRFRKQYWYVQQVYCPISKPHYFFRDGYGQVERSTNARSGSGAGDCPGPTALGAKSQAANIRIP